MATHRSQPADAGLQGEANSADRDSKRPVPHLDELIATLEAADAAFRTGSEVTREQTLSDGLAAISALYGCLDVERSPETSAHLEAVYDACLRALGDAYGGDVEALPAAATMARAIRTALAPSSVGRSPKLRRAA